MLIIRPEQMRAFRDAALDDFCERAAAHFIEADPGRVGYRWIRSVIEQLMARGIDQRQAIWRYLELCAEYEDALWMESLPDWTATPLNSPHSQVARVESLREFLDTRADERANDARH